MSRSAVLSDIVFDLKYLAKNLEQYSAKVNVQIHVNVHHFTLYTLPTCLKIKINVVNLEP